MAHGCDGKDQRLDGHQGLAAHKQRPSFAQGYKREYAKFTLAVLVTTNSYGYQSNAREHFVRLRKGLSITKAVNIGVQLA
jgi:hypothetical protein